MAVMIPDEIQTFTTEGQGVFYRFLRSVAKPDHQYIAWYLPDIQGRGTNRVIAMCRKHGVSPPRFEERQGFLIVTFKSQMVAAGTARVDSKVESKVGSKVESRSSLEDRIAAAVRRGPLSKSEIAIAIGKQKVDGQLHSAVRQMLQTGLIEYMLPDKPNSRLQRYRLTNKGQSFIAKLAKEAGEDEE